MIYGIDISNWQYENERSLILQHRPTHVVVRASTESERLRQIAIEQCKTVIEMGCALDLYSWAYPWTDPRQQIDAALTIPADAGTPFHNIWIDVEETQTQTQTLIRRKAMRMTPTRFSVPAMGDRLRVLHAKTLTLSKPKPRKLASQFEPWLDGAFGRLDELGVASGIYTGRWFWVDYVGNSQRFKDRRLWFSNYDSIPDLATWQHQSFGGWEQPVGKQWSSDPIDRNVFLESILAGSVPTPPVQGDALAQLRFMSKHVLNVNETQLREEATRLTAMADELARIREQYAWAL